VTTSGDTDLTVNRNEIVRAAYVKLTVVDANVTTLPAILMQDGTRQLNSMIARWRKAGVHIWKLREITLWPQAAQRRYNISLTSPDHCTETYFQTTILAAQSVGATVIGVTSSANMVVGDQIGIVLDGGRLHWSTVAAVPSSTSVTIVLPLALSVSAGNMVWNYHATTTCTVPRPVGIGRGNGSYRRHDPVGLIDTPIGPLLSHLDYDSLPNKDGPGTITQGFYDLQLAAGYLSVWEVPPRVDNLVKMTAQLPIEYFDHAADTPDFPVEWIDALVYNLADMLSGEADVPAAARQDIQMRAAQYLAEAAAEDREGESLFFQPDMDGARGYSHGYVR
jgi:hypothetical protein